VHVVRGKLTQLPQTAAPQSLKNTWTRFDQDAEVVLDMATGVIVTMIVLAVAWFMRAGLTARRQSPETPVATKASAFAPASATTATASANERAIALVPLPSAFDRNVTVKSLSERGRTYEVNPGRLTCTCEDFERRRTLLPAHDIRRVCKHLGRTLEATNALTLYDEVAQALIRPQKASHKHLIEHGVDAERFVVLPDATDVIVLALRSDSAWVAVVTQRGTKARIKKYKRYSYNVDERRWSYGSSPYSDRDILHAIHTWFAR
jgi:hypothetical protein